MSLENIGVIDAAGLETATDTVVLSIIDSWTWDDERQHLTALQAKLNAYFEFIESGQIYEAYKDSQGKALRIDVIFKYPVPGSCASLLSKANEVASQLDVGVSLKLLAES
ncbi:DUF6572 domain-containing protein [Roseateles chitinivorans]|uniref:DUF6572 domain-containing protein n=1 Tax=Roseateles chitinivorans TaxID=2917965 RepID=UPI003D67470F